MATINDILAQLVGQGTQAVAENAPAIAQGAGQAAASASNNTPSIMGILSSLIANQGAGQVQAGSQAQASDGGTGFGKPPKQELDDFQKGVGQYAKEAGYNQSKQLHEVHGKPVREILEYAGNAQPQDQVGFQPANQPNMAQPGSQPVTRDEVLGFLSEFAKQQGQQQTAQPMAQAPQQGQVLPATSLFGGGGVDSNFNVTQPGVGRQILGSLIPMFAPGANVTENIEKQGKMMDNAMKLQKLQGKEPYQAGEQQKNQELYSAQLKQKQAETEKEAYKALTPEAGAKFSALLEGRDATATVSNMLLGTDGAGLISGNKFTPDFFKGDGIRRYNSALEIAIQAKTRSETGAALAPKELQNTMKRYQPRVGDSTQTIKARLKPLFGYFDSAIQTADPYGVHQERAQKTQLVASNLDAINRTLAKRGVKL